MLLTTPPSFAEVSFSCLTKLNGKISSCIEYDDKNFAAEKVKHFCAPAALELMPGLKQEKEFKNEKCTQANVIGACTFKLGAIDYAYKGSDSEKKIKRQLKAFKRGCERGGIFPTKNGSSKQKGTFSDKSS